MKHLLAALVALAVATTTPAQSRPFAIVGASSSFTTDGNDYTETGQIVFHVRNVSAEPQTMITSGDCGVFLPINADGWGSTCVAGASPYSAVVPSGSTVDVTLPIPLGRDAGRFSGTVTLTAWPSGDASLGTQVVVRVTWDSSVPQIWSELLEATYTPAMSPRAPAIAADAHNPAYTSAISIANAGNAAATYVFSARCSGAITSCGVSPATATVQPGASTAPVVTYSAGAPGSGAIAIIAQAPPRASGVVDADSVTVSVAVTDQYAPVMTMTPAGEVVDAAYGLMSPITVQTRATLAVDVCDRDGVIGIFYMYLNNQVVPWESISMAPASGCYSAIHATFKPPFVPGSNRVVVYASDYVHTPGIDQTYVYDDTYDHVAQVTAARTNPQIGVNQVVVDTFLVKNPGWRAAQYTFAAVCSYSTGSPLCPAPVIESGALTIGPGVTAAVPVTYQSPAGLATNTTVQLTASLAGTALSSRAALVATTAAVLSPRIAFSPSNGTIVTTPTIDLSVTWCDPDDYVMSHSATWQGSALQSLTIAFPGCRTELWRGLAIAPWNQVVTATATDAQGHTTTRSATITYNAPMSAFQPRISPRGGTHRVRPNAAAADTFAVTNTGPYPVAYALAASCGGLANCTVTPASLSLSDSASAKVVIGYQGTATFDVPDSIRLVATYTAPVGSVIADTAKRAVVAPSVEALPAVTSYVTGVHAIAPGMIELGFYRIRNAGTAQVTLALRWDFTGGYGFPAWGAPDSVITLDPGQGRDVYAYVRAPSLEGMAGVITLTASYVSSGGDALVASAASSWITRTPRPAIAITPRSTTRIVAPGATSNEVGFAVANVGNAPISVADSVVCQGAAINCRWSPAGQVLGLADVSSVTVNFDLASGAQTGSIKLVARGVTDVSVADDATITLMTTPSYIALQVSPKAVSRIANRSRVFPQRYYVTNTGTVPGWVTLAMSCDLTVTCSNPQPGNLYLVPGQRDSSLVSITSPARDSVTGRARLIAAATTPTIAADTGVVTVSSAVVADVVVSVRNASSGATIARDQCLTIAAGEGAAYECGDLRLQHTLPATTTMNRARAPTLTYVSRHASAIVLFPADVSIAPGNGVTSIHARVTIDGRAPADTVFRWDDTWSTGTPRRVVIPVDVVGRGVRTGAYHYTLSVEAVSSASTIQAQDSGTVAIVGRVQSPFGAGWWLDGLEQLVSVDTSHKLWVGGDGSTRLYTRVRDSIWTVTPTVDRPDTLIVRSLAAYRHLRNGALVQFDNLGRHVATVDPRGERTSFNYDSNIAKLLTSIDLPVPASSSVSAAAHRYTFTYVPAADGQNYLSQVDAPSSPQGPRAVLFDHAAGPGLVSAITGPDATGVHFDFENGRVAGRTNRRGFRTAIGYDPQSQTLSETRADLGATGEAIRSRFCASEAASISACAPAPMDVDSIETTYDGPRDVMDLLRVQVTNVGAPSRITDASGAVTRIERTSAVWPLLPTAVIRPNGFTTRVAYNRRALVETQTDEAPLFPVSSANAVTRFVWNDSSRFDLLEAIEAPTGEVSRFGYTGNGDRLWQEDGRRGVSRAWFSYNDSRQLSSIQSPGNSTSQLDAFDYDPLLGNLWRTTSPVGVSTTYHVDAIGRVDSVYTAGAAGYPRVQATTFDVMDRAIEQRDIGPPVPYTLHDVSATAPAVTLVVATMYDAEGNVDSTRRTSVPDLTGQGALTLRWTYDGANRRLTATDAYGKTDSVRYDPAGNVVRTVSRRHLTVTTTYDELNRPLTRTTQATTYDPSVMGYAPDVGAKVRFPHFAPGFAYDIQASPTTMPPALVIPADVARFGYDVSGNLVLADNHDAQVRRGYYRNGALRADTLRVAVVDTVETPDVAPFSQHSYVLNYEYDISGRRTLRADGVPGCADCAQVYTYDPLSGALESTVDRGATFRFDYDSAGRVRMRSAQTAGVDSITTWMRYDAAGRLIDRLVAGGVYHDVLAYDDAGRVRTSSIGSTLPGIADNTEQVYNGLGAVAAMFRERGGVEPLDQYTTDAFGNTVQRKQWLGGMGVTSDHAYGGDRLASIHQSPLNWALGDGQPAMTRLDQSSNDFDLSGNIVRAHSNRSTYDLDYQSFMPRVVGNEWTWNAYSADEKLRVSQRTFMVTDAVPRTAFVEHRYDALGRRVFTRTRWDQYCEPKPLTGECLSTIDHTEFDGDQVLMEYRNVAGARVYEQHPDCYPDSDSLSEACVDHYSPRWSQDGQGIALERESTAGNFSGVVRYTHAGGIDDPLAIWKSGFAVGIIPHRSWRGLYEAGSFLGPSADDISWPGRDRDAFHAPDARFAATAPPPTHWLGSIVDGKTDASGLMYMRNRYYDPRSGRFTQEDPIGLAGGMNLYGFGGGDPVNNSDPFGLCPPQNATPCGRTGALIGGVAGAGVGVAMIAGCATVTVGICAAGAPAIFAVTSGLGASVGGLVETAFAWFSSEAEEASSLVPTAGGRPTRDERDAVNKIGGKTGCMTCGAKNPGTKSGDWVTNHVPPTSVKIPGEQQQLGPHCLPCSQRQGGFINAEKNRKRPPSSPPEDPHDPSLFTTEASP